MQDGCWQLWSRLFLQKGDGKKLTDKCAEMIVEVYLQDMTAKRATVKDIHKLQGFERKSPVAIGVDKQYKNPLKTLFIPATQSVKMSLLKSTCDHVTTMKPNWPKPEPWGSQKGQKHSALTTQDVRLHAPPPTSTWETRKKGANDAPKTYGE